LIDDSAKTYTSSSHFRNMDTQTGADDPGGQI
jgi:hypothetical protein